MSGDIEYIVVGGGGIGSATAYFLARQGKSVLVLEQFEIGHDRGSSHGESRIIRYIYEQPQYVRLAKRAYSLWDRVEEESGRKLVHKVGGINLEWPGRENTEKCLAALSGEGIPHELLPYDEATRRFPYFNIENGTSVIWQADTGFLVPDDCVPTFSELARKHGAVVEENTEVKSIRADGGKVTVETDKHAYSAKTVIVTVGAWAEELLASMGVELPMTVTCEQYAFVRVGEGTPLSKATDFPIFINYASGDDPYFYGFPQVEDSGLKVAEHHAGAHTTANTRSFDPDSAKLARLLRNAQKLIPDLTTDVLKVKTCLYTSTLDHHFVIDQVPGVPSVYFAAGMSGHGFKFISALGELIGEYAQTGQRPPLLDLFKLERLKESIDLVSQMSPAE